MAKIIDWEAVEIHYRAGIRSLKDIGKEFGVSDAGIIKKASREGWTRDLSAKIQAKAEAKVLASLVSKEVSDSQKLTEALTIEVESTVRARIQLSHRTDISRARNICMSLLGELESQTMNMPGMQELAEYFRAPNDNNVDRLNDAYRASISLPERTKTMKALSESLKSLIGLEREAYHIADDAKKVDVTITKSAKDMTDDELAALASGSS